ncbi:MAG: hypothetical protein NTY19_08625 [Planctomycetota bacterium]|nr:hypothetical protein [Planctomycetota bacterium]
MLKKLWCFETLIFLGLWLILMGCYPWRFFLDPGTFWHTTIGLRILETGQLPQADTFTYTVHGQPWISQDWLYQVAMALLYKLGGWDSLLVVTVVLLAAMYAWLAGRLFSAGLDGVCATGVVILAFAACLSQFHVRPLILTMVLTGLSFALLVDVESGRRPLRHLWWYVPISLFWTNVHGGVLGGLGTFVLVAGGWMLCAVIGRESPIRCRRDGIELAGILAACGLTVLVNPYGLELPRLWFEILRLPLSDSVREHWPLWRFPFTAIPSISLVVLYLVALLGTWPRFPRSTWLMPLVWFILAYSRTRHASLFVIVAVVALGDMLPYSRLSRWLAWRGFFHGPSIPDASYPRSGWRRFVVPAAVLVIALLLQANSVQVPILGRGWVQLEPTYWPIQLLPELRELESQNSPRVRIFNDCRYGGFLIFHTPALPVFQDDRCELFGAAFLKRYDNLYYHDPGEIDHWDAQLGFSHAIVEEDSKLDRYLAGSSRWETIRRTPAGVLYRKKSPGIDFDTAVRGAS